MALHERKQVQRSFHREFGYRGIEDFHHQQVCVMTRECHEFSSQILFSILGRSGKWRRKMSHYVKSLMTSTI